MRNTDLRIALQLDYHRAWMYSLKVARAEPEMFFIYSNTPRKIRRVVEDYQTRHVKSDYDEHVDDYFRSLLEHLQGATEVVLVGPGRAKEEFLRAVRETPRYRELMVRASTSEWLDEKQFEKFARENLRVPDDTPNLYLREGRFIPHRRMGGPGAPVDPADYHRTVGPKGPRESSMNG